MKYALLLSAFAALLMATFAAPARAQTPPDLYAYGRTLAATGNGIGQVLQPDALAFAPNGDLYVAEASNHRVSVFPAGGRPARVWPVTLRGVPVKTYFSAVTVASDGTVYAADYTGNRVLVAGADGANAREIGASAPGRLLHPQGVAVAPGGGVYVADSGHDRIVIFAPDGAFRSTFGSGGKGFEQFSTPCALAFSPDGRTLYIADANNDRVVACDPDGRNRRVLPFRDRDTKEWDVPGGLAVAPDGTLFIGSHVGSRVQVYDAGGVLRGAFGGSGTGDGQFSLVKGIARGPDGAIYAADYGNSRIEIFMPVSAK